MRHSVYWSAGRRLASLSIKTCAVIRVEATGSPRVKEAVLNLELH